MKVAMATIIVCMLIVGIAEAAQVDICHSTHVAGSIIPRLDNSTTFHCPALGVVTIPQIYQLGARVGQVMQHIEADPNNPFNSQAGWIIIIETP
jgi:hypothetical protein